MTDATHRPRSVVVTGGVKNAKFSPLCVLRGLARAFPDQLSRQGNWGEEGWNHGWTQMNMDNEA